MVEQIRPSVVTSKRLKVRKTIRGYLWFFDHWVLIFSVLFGIVLVAPFLAPIFMVLRWTGPAQAIYFIYSFLCHQMAQRCFFLFGSQPMYNAAQLPLTLTGNMDADMLSLRAFVGNANAGWKVAWSDRMVYMYGALWLAGMAFGVLRHRRRFQPLSFVGFGLLLLPMVIDGGTHWLSDTISGLANGFRYDNQWLATLTGNALPHLFYYGDAFGSFNSWMRLITGVLFGIAVVWLSFPQIDRGMQEAAAVLREKLARAEALGLPPV